MKLKKILASILALALVLSTMGTVTFAEDAASVWDGETYSLEWLEAGNPEGTAGDKYYLNSAEDLAGLAYYVNTYAGTNNIFTGDIVYLNVDVDLDNQPWNPIGTAVPGEKNRFYGSFDGQGHTISNLTVAEGHYYAGLFGQIPTYNYTQTFSNVTLNNVIAVAADETSKNKEGAGALIGRANGTIIDNCHVTGEINISADRFVGGLLGHSYAQISDCSVKATGTINADTWQAGGLVGAHGATAMYTSSINDCTVEGGDTGLAITSYYAAAGGAIGNVSVDGVDSTTIDGITVENVSVEADDDSYGAGVALVASGGTATNATISDVTTTVANEDAVPVDAEATIDGVYYTSFYEAVKNAASGTTVELVSDVTYGVWNSIWNKDGLTINGNNHTLTVGAVDSGINGSGLFLKAKNLTINDLNVVLPTEVTNGERPRLATMESGELNNVSVSGGNHAVSIIGTGSVSINDCNFENIDGWAIETESRSTSADASLTITNSTFDEKAVIIRGENTTFTDNKIVNAGEGVNVLGNATITGNDFGESTLGIDQGRTVTIENNIINSVEFPNWFGVTEEDYSALTVEENTMSDEAVAAFNEKLEEDVVSVDYVATIGDKFYYSLQNALDAATDGDIITIFAGTYDAFTVPTDKNNLTFIGETDAEGNNLATIRTLEEGIDTNTRGVCVQPETVTFKNLNFTAGTATNRGGWMTSSLGNTNGDTGLSSKLKQLNVENCNFVGSGEYSAIWMNNGSVNFVNSTVENYAYGVYVYAIKDDQVVNVTGSDISTSNRAVFNQEGSVNGEVKVTDSVIDAPYLTVGGEVPATFTGNEITGVTFYMYGETEMTENALIDCKFRPSRTGNISLAENYVNNPNEIENDAATRNVTFASYYGTKADLEANSNLVTVPEKADVIYVQYKKTDIDADGNDTVEGQDTYEIVLAGKDAEKINELASADLTFEFVGTPVTNGAMSYTVTPATGVSLTQLGDRFMFNYDGITKYEETGAAIVIGTITIDGYGTYTLKTAESDYNAVYATEIADNIVDGFEDAATLIINTDMKPEDGMVGEIPEGNIAVPTRELTINIDFPNAVVDNEIAYQDMKVEITGNIDGVNKTVTYNLGEDEEAMVDGDYVVTEDKLVLNNAYTVTVSGAGYRTARYTVTMTDDKQLNFWNNVKDEAQVVEVDKDSSVAKVTFLAGDIVKDNNINIYDLSAVVSYFGTEELVEKYPEYAKYDLNRDGVIDSKDVAYVLVSWGK